MQKGPCSNFTARASENLICIYFCSLSIMLCVTEDSGQLVGSKSR